METRTKVLSNCQRTKVRFVAAAGICLLFSFLTAQSAVAAPKKHGKVKVWKIEQRDQLGKSVTLISDDGIVVKSPQQNVKWVCTAPDWKVTIVNYKLNLGKLADLAIYSQCNPDKIEYGDLRKNGSILSTHQAFLGRTARKCLYKTRGSDPVRERVEMMYQTGSQRAGSFSSVELIVSQSIKMKPQIQAFLSGKHNIDGLDGVVFSKTNIYPGGRRHNVLSTDSIIQTVVDASELQRPTGYKLAPVHEIMQETQKALEMSGVIKDLFFDDPKEKRRKGSN